MAQHEIARPRAEKLRRPDIALLADLQDLPADEARGRGPSEQDERDEHRKDPAFSRSDAKGDLEQDHEQQERQRDDEIGEPHQDLVRAPADKARGAAVDDADDDEEQRRHDTNEERHARAVHEARQHVAAEIVGAERVIRQHDLVTDRDRIGIVDPAERFGLGGADHSRRLDPERHVAVGFRTVRVERDDRVPVGNCLEIEPVLETDLSRIENLGHGQTERAVGLRIVDIAVQLVAGGARYRIPGEAHGLRCRRFDEPEPVRRRNR